MTSSGTSARPRVRKSSSLEAQVPPEDVHLSSSHRGPNWRRILLLIVAITVHNIPEGLAVGVGFGAVGKSTTATFENARYVIRTQQSKNPVHRMSLHGVMHTGVVNDTCSILVWRAILYFLLPTR